MEKLDFFNLRDFIQQVAEQQTVANRKMFEGISHLLLRIGAFSVRNSSKTTLTI